MLKYKIFKQFNFKHDNNIYDFYPRIKQNIDFLTLGKNKRYLIVFMNPKTNRAIFDLSNDIKPYMANVFSNDYCLTVIAYRKSGKIIESIYWK